MRPRTDNPLHIMQEAIDNAADEALGVLQAHSGHATPRWFGVDSGRRARYPGRNSPDRAGANGRSERSTILHRWRKPTAWRRHWPIVPRSPHGAGVSVTTPIGAALQRLKRHHRGGSRHQIVFSGGAVIEPLQRIGDAPKKASGTRVCAWPDAQSLLSPNIPAGELERLLRSKAAQAFVLNFTARLKAQTNLVLRQRHAAIFPLNSSTVN